MKKPFVLLGILALSLSSCKKDRTCVCTTIHTNYLGTTTDPAITTTYKKIKKSEAVRICQKTTDDYNATRYYAGSISGGTMSLYTYDCKLK